MLTIFDTKTNTAESNMKLDSELLQNLGQNPILHLYDWESPSLTYGYFIRPEKFLNVDALKKQGIAFAKRPTGGGIVFHIWDLAFSFLMPASAPGFSLNPLDNYHFVNGLVLQALQPYLQKHIELTPDHFPSSEEAAKHFCMARPTKYDVIWKGLKIAGAAQRLTKAGYLHQGTISLAPPDLSLLNDVLLSPTLVEAMQQYTFSIPIPLPSARAQVKNLLIDTFTSRFI